MKITVLLYNTKIICKFLTIYFLGKQVALLQPSVHSSLEITNCSFRHAEL